MFHFAFEGKGSSSELNRTLNLKMFVDFKVYTLHSNQKDNNPLILMVHVYIQISILSHQRI